jgi:hypothetical protein
VSRPARIEIDVSALRHNHRLLRRAHGGRVLAVLKADAYGHGAERFANALAVEADGGCRTARSRRARSAARCRSFGGHHAYELPCKAKRAPRVTESRPRRRQRGRMASWREVVSEGLAFVFVRLGRSSASLRSGRPRKRKLPN